VIANALKDLHMQVFHAIETGPLLTGAVDLSLEVSPEVARTEFRRAWIEAVGLCSDVVQVLPEGSGILKKGDLPFDVLDANATGTITVRETGVQSHRKRVRGGEEHGS